MMMWGHATARRNNFDIYLPVGVAGRSKLLFGSLFLFGAAVTFARWTG